MVSHLNSLFRILPEDDTSCFGIYYSLLIATHFPHETQWTPLSNEGGQFYVIAGNRTLDLLCVRRVA